MKRVLLISYYYLPMPAVGALRAAGLAKYLPEFGWEVVVLHGPLDNKGGLVHRIFNIDPNQNMLAQAQELQRKVKIPIEWALKLYAEWLKYPDTVKDWEKSMRMASFVHLVSSTLKGKLPNAIISTSSPVRCHMVAKNVKEQIHVPWIADFRDLWTQNHYYPYSRIRLYRERKLELQTMEIADALVTASEPLAETLGQLHSREVHTIPNGYDPDDLIKEATIPDKRILTYTGSIYRGHQSPEPLFRDILEDTLYCLKEDVMPSARTYWDEIRFYGPRYDWLDKLAKRYKNYMTIKQYGMVSREEALQAQREAHTLLLLKWHGIEGGTTSKLFEYMAAKKPILAIGPPDSYVDKIIEDANNGDIEQYSQREMARRFAEVLEKVTKCS